MGVHARRPRALFPLWIASRARDREGAVLVGAFRTAPMRTQSNRGRCGLLLRTPRVEHAPPLYCAPMLKI